MLKVRAVLKIERDVLGPGERVGVWFQGCSLRCRGCMVPETWDSSEGKSYLAEELFREIESFGLKEVTLSGGEPFEQERESLLKFLSLLKRENYGIICYSGYQIEELINQGFSECKITRGLENCNRGLKKLGALVGFREESKITLENFTCQRWDYFGSMDMFLDD